MKAKWNFGIKISGVAVFLMVLTGCGRHEDPWEKVAGEGPKVLVSFPPLYCFTKKVAGEHAKVLSLLTKVGPHDYSPSASDAIKSVKADVFLVNGLTLDDWVTKVANSSGNPKFKKDRDNFLVHVGEFLPKSKDEKKDARDKNSDTLLKFGHDHDHDHGHAHAHAGHSHGEYDPHVWLGIAPAKSLVKNMSVKLGELAPEHKGEYEANAAKYIVELENLQAYGEELFKDKKNRKIIATHDSMKYFARSFGLTVLDNIQPQAGVEASNKDLQRLIEICKKENVRVITVEPQYGETTAKTLQKQLKDQGVEVELVTFDTLETVNPEHAADPDYYMRKMRDNIKALADKMQ
jgi:zinc transport system substrate-binding protein